MKKLYVANVIFTAFNNQKKCIVAFVSMNDLETIVKALSMKMAKSEFKFSSVEIEATNLLEQE